MSPALFTTSWDDGCPEDAHIAELLDRYGMRGTFYATARPAGVPPIDLHVLAGIGDRHELANHGLSHRAFTQLSDQELRDEAASGGEQLGQLGSISRFIAPPRGKMNARVLRTLREEGWQVRSAPILGRTSAPRADALDPSFHLYPHGWAALARNTIYRRAVPALSMLRAWAAGGNVRAKALRLLRVAAERQPLVHVWGHGWEIEHLGLWEELEAVLAEASTLGLRPVTNSEALGQLLR